MRYLLQVNKTLLLAYFLIDEKILTLKQKLFLLKEFDGEIDKIVRTDNKKLKSILKKRNDIDINWQNQFKKAQNLLDDLNKGVLNYKFTTILDNDYPFLPYYIGDFDIQFLPSPVIFYKGDINILNKTIKISIVGTRNPQSISVSSVENIICSINKKVNKNINKNINKKFNSLKQKDYENVVIVSGFAKGIDYKTHEFSILNDIKTVGVIGSGINIIYPSTNLYLYKKFLETDNLIISEYPPDTPPLKQNFPFRNRLIALLSDIVFLIQAGIPSGGLITVDYALKLGKDVFVFNPEYDKNFEGNKKLLKNGKCFGFFYIDEENIYINKFRDLLFDNDTKLNNLENISFILKNEKDFEKKYFKKIIKKIFETTKLNINIKNFLKIYFTIFKYPYIGFNEIVDQTYIDISEILSILTKLEAYNMIKKTIDNKYFVEYKNLYKIEQIGRINEK